MADKMGEHLDSGGGAHGLHLPRTLAELRVIEQRLVARFQAKHAAKVAEQADYDAPTVGQKIADGVAATWAAGASSSSRASFSFSGSAGTSSGSKAETLIEDAHLHVLDLRLKRWEELLAIQQRQMEMPPLAATEPKPTLTPRPPLPLAREGDGGEGTTP